MEPAFKGQRDSKYNNLEVVICQEENLSTQDLCRKRDTKQPTLNWPAWGPWEQLVKGQWQVQARWVSHVGRGWWGMEKGQRCSFLLSPLDQALLRQLISCLGHSSGASLSCH